MRENLDPGASSLSDLGLDLYETEKVHMDSLVTKPFYIFCHSVNVIFTCVNLREPTSAVVKLLEKNYKILLSYNC